MSNSDVSSLPSILGDNRIEEMSRKELSKNPLAHRSSYENYFIKKEMNEVDRAMYLLKEGDAIQKAAVYGFLPSLFLGSTKKMAIKTILEEQLMEHLWKEQPEEQVSVGIALVSIVKHLPRATVGKMFSFFQSMMSVKHDRVSEAWEEVFYVAVPKMPKKLLETTLMEYVKKKGSQFETERNRAFCGKFLGILCKNLDRKHITEHLMALIINMCQDTSYTVRKHMAKNLALIARRVGAEKTKECLAAELFQLLDDETKEVKIQAFHTTVDLMEFFDQKFRVEKIVPLIAQLVENPPHDLFPHLVQQLGPILTRLAIRNEATTALFCEFFNQCCAHKLPTIRVSCAFNFPAVVQGVGWKEFVSRRGTLFRSYMALAKDDRSEKIRYRVACSIHIIAQLIEKPKNQVGSNCFTLLNDIYVTLLKDKNDKVRNKAFSNLAIMLDSFFNKNICGKREINEDIDGFIRARNNRPSTSSSSGKKKIKIKKMTFKQKKQVSDIYSSLITEYHEAIGARAWRKLMELFLNVKCCCHLFPREIIFHNFIPMVRKYLVNAPVPLKELSCRVIVVMSRALEHSGLQIAFFKSLCSDLGNGKSFWQRIAFLEIVSHVMETYSRRFFKTHLIEHVIRLAEDKVSEVKRKFCSVMPQLKRVLSPSSDVKFIAILKERSSFLVLDKDASVIAAANKANEEIAQIEKEVLRGIANPMSFHNRDNVRDREKEMVERKWDIDSSNGDVNDKKTSTKHKVSGGKGGKKKGTRKKGTKTKRKFKKGKRNLKSRTT